MSTPERRAYRNAWRLRQTTGNASHALLLDELKACGANPVWSEPDGDLHKWLLGCWDRGVTPRGLAVEARKRLRDLVPTIVKAYRDAYREIVRNLR